MKCLARALLAAATSLVFVGCPSQEIPTPEAPTRKIIPIPVCTEQMAPPRRRAQEGKPMIRSVDPERWLEIVVPDYEIEKGMNPTDVDCTGQFVFANELLRFGLSKHGWPHTIDVEDIDMRAGPGGMRVLRLRALEFENGDSGGPIALVRAMDDRAEVFGIGSYKGPKDAKLQPVRMGNETLVFAEEKRCPDPTNCRKVGKFFLLRRGRLLDAATIDIERVQRVPSIGEKGLYAEYSLRTDVTYQPDGIHLLEQVKVKIIPYEDKGDRDSDRLLRTVEFARLLQVERDTLFSTNESLWERVVGQD